MKKRYISFFVFLLFLFSSCANKNEHSSDKPLVYTSFYPVYEMTKMIGDDTIDVESFMPLDKQPHLWEPSPKDMKKQKMHTMMDATKLISEGDYWKTKESRRLLGA